MSDKWVGSEEKHRRPVESRGEAYSFSMKQTGSDNRINQRSSNKRAEWVCQLNQLVDEEWEKKLQGSHSLLIIYPVGTKKESTTRRDIQLIARVNSKGRTNISVLRGKERDARKLLGGEDCLHDYCLIAVRLVFLMGTSRALSCVAFLELLLAYPFVWSVPNICDWYSLNVNKREIRQWEALMPSGMLSTKKRKPSSYPRFQQPRPLSEPAHQRR